MARIHGAKILDETGSDIDHPELPEERHEHLERLAADAAERKKAEFQERMRARG